MNNGWNNNGCNNSGCNNNGNCNCHCKCEKGVRLPGAKFALLNGCGCEIACAVTNEKGELCFGYLPFGKYYLKEVEAPCGYEKSCETIEVWVSCDHDCRVVEVINNKKLGSIKLIKYGRD